MRTSVPRLRGWLAGLACGLVACAGTPPPDWQLDAHAALGRAVAAELAGDSRIASIELRRARAEIARSGRVDLMARAELAHCAARLAALQYERCSGFEAIREDAPAAERAYADYLLGAVQPEAIGLLPAHHRAAAAAGDAVASDVRLLQSIAEPLSRLVVAAVWLRVGRATPAVVDLAVQTASAQGWRRPLLAWLKVQELDAARAGDRSAQDRTARRIRLILGDLPKQD